MIGAFANHLWQSTVFAVVAGLLTVGFRKNRAHVRYWLWFSASVKFFVPFTLLINLGGQLDWVPAAQQRAAPFTMMQISQPFSEGWSTDVPLAPPTPRTPDWSRVVVLVVWVCGFGAIALIRMRVWRRIQAAVRASTAWKRPGVEMPASVDVRTSPGLLEPGVVGLWRPILLLPASIEEHLTPPQLEAVLAHELCHIRRHDNVTATIHMIVEAVFWFHPVVWWIGARLVEERERACDEDVLRAFGAPRAYAEGILNVCKSYVESPLVCVSGVSGDNLRKRIEAIMKNEVGATLKFGKKCLLGAAAAVAIAAPIVIGVVNGPRLEAQQPAKADASSPAFEVASVKPNPSGGRGFGPVTPPGTGRYTMTSVTLQVIIRSAYAEGQNSLLPSVRLSGGPTWIDAERFDIVAKAEDGLNPLRGQYRLMLQYLLADRFKLEVHWESRELPIYALVMARSDGRRGPNLRPPDIDCGAVFAGGPEPPPQPGQLPSCGIIQSRPGHMTARGRSMEILATDLSTLVDRPVENRTNVPGYFDADLDWAPVDLATANGPSLVTALQEQLGLKLESTRGPVEVLVIDSVERPTPD